MVKATVESRESKDVEAGGAGPTKHYVPVLELFRGHWQGILVQTCYEACEYCGPHDLLYVNSVWDTLILLQFLSLLLGQEVS
jgi:hypothetical protein